MFLKMIDAISFWLSGYSALVIAKVSDIKSLFCERLESDQNLQDFLLGTV